MNNLKFFMKFIITILGLVLIFSNSFIDDFWRLIFIILVVIYLAFDILVDVINKKYQ